MSNNVTLLDRHAKTTKHLYNERTIHHVQPITTLMTNKMSVDKLERKVAMFLVEHNIPFNCAGHLTQLIKVCAKNPAATEQMKCSSTKATKMVTNIFGPEQKASLAKMLQNQRFSIIMDETTDMASKKCLAITVRYFDKRVVSRLLCFLEVPQATAQHLFDALKSTLAEMQVPFNNIVGFKFYGGDNS